jgi:hypothetical protein
MVSVECDPLESNMDQVNLNAQELDATSKMPMMNKEGKSQI